MNHKIVITGASSEIGQAICNKVIKAGDYTILQYFKNKTKLLSLKEKYGNNCQIYFADFNDSESLTNFCKNIKDTDILINVAGCTISGLLPTLTEEDVKIMINVNIVALVKICQNVIPDMVAKREGCIVNISSVTASRGNRGQTVYAGTKGFIESFTRSMAAEYGHKGIRINCVAPGPINAGSLKELLVYAPEDVKQSIASNRLGEPNDVASLVAFLCSKEAGFINGQCIHIDGGFMRGV